MRAKPSQRYAIIGGKVARFKLASNGARALPTETFERFHGNRKAAQLKEQINRKVYK